MDPFTLWLLGSVVAPDAYERVVNTLNTKSAEDRLAKRVHEDVGRYPKRVFRRWYRQDEPPRVHRRLGCLSPAMLFGVFLLQWAASNSAGGT